MVNNKNKLKYSKNNELQKKNIRKMMSNIYDEEKSESQILPTESMPTIFNKVVNIDQCIG